MANYTNTELYDLAEIIELFEQRFKQFSFATFDGQTMRKILNGDLVLVKHSGTKNFSVWTKQQIENGDLIALNKKIKRANMLSRVEAQKAQNEFNNIVIAALKNFNIKI